MNPHYKTLEFDKILNMLAENALSEAVKTRCLALAPSLNQAEARRWIDETTQARRILEQAGTPPLSPMTELQKALGLVQADAMLLPEQLEQVLSFLAACRRMRAYLKRAEATDSAIAWYGGHWMTALPTTFVTSAASSFPPLNRSNRSSRRCCAKIKFGFPKVLSRCVAGAIRCRSSASIKMR